MLGFIKLIKLLEKSIVVNLGKFSNIILVLIEINSL